MGKGDLGLNLKHMLLTTVCKENEIIGSQTQTKQCSQEIKMEEGGPAFGMHRRSLIPGLYGGAGGERERLVPGFSDQNT